MTATQTNTPTQNFGTGEAMLSRKELADRWGVCVETIKRYERAGRLPALCLGPRLKRYRLADVLRIEAEMRIGRSGGAQ